MMPVPSYRFLADAGSSRDPTAHKCSPLRILREGEAVCWLCRSDAVDLREFMTAASERLTRFEALNELMALASSTDPESAHGAAEMVLLQLIGDPEIAAAFYAVPKWYA